jgi:hypothetical protein
MLAQVRRYLDEYQEKYRRPGFPALELSGMYALFPEEGLADFVESRWNDPYPNADRKGVYLIFGRTGLLLYIGRASMGTTIGGRLGTYFAGKTECRLLSTDWTERPTYVATIAVPPGLSFEAPALEEYLIRCLNPCDNNLGAPGQVPAGGILRVEMPVPGPEAKPMEAASSAVPPGPDVYTYSAPGMPMCPACGQRPAIFYCSTHQSAACLECVARHDVPGECMYLPQFRAPKPAAGPATKSEPALPPSAAKPRSILGIG